MNQDKPKPIIPTYDRLMSPTLRALIELGGSASNQEIEQKVAELFGFTEEQLAILHGRGRQSEIAYREAWARTYLRADGAIDQSGRGIWVITDRGRNLSADEIDSLPKRVKATYRTRGRNEEGAEESAGDDESPTTLLDSALKDWREALLDLLRSLPPDAFERLSQRVLRESGFTSVEVTGKSGDGGIDGIGVLSISLLSFQVLFQCKRYTGPVGPKEIRDFRGAMVGRTDKGLFLTTGVFTPEAKREAARDGAPVLDLIDGQRLCDLLKDLGLGVSTRLVEEVIIQPDWFSHL